MKLSLRRLFVSALVALAAVVVSVSASASTECTQPIPLSGAVVTVRRAPAGSGSQPTRASETRANETATEAEGLVWDARYIVDVDAAFDLRGGLIPMAVPLPHGETLRPDPGVTAVMDSDHRIVGLCVAREALHERTVEAFFDQPATTNLSDVTIALGAPIAGGSTLQIIDGTLNAGNETRLDVRAGDILERHVGYVAPRAIGHAARDEARRLTDVKARINTSPIYVRGDDVHVAGGLTGQIVDGRARAKNSAFSIGMLFLMIVGALVWAARRLRLTASIERADAVLASEIDHAAHAACHAEKKSKLKLEPF